MYWALDMVFSGGGTPPTVPSVWDEPIVIGGVVAFEQDLVFNIRTESTDDVATAMATTVVGPVLPDRIASNTPFRFDSWSGE